MIDFWDLVLAQFVPSIVAVIVAVFGYVAYRFWLYRQKKTSKNRYDDYL